MAVLEVVGDGNGTGEGAGGGSPQRRFIPLKRTELCGDVAGPLAALRLTQVFGYSAAECTGVLEAVYRFPLPGDAAVTAVRVQFGDVAIRARLDDRARAETDYATARREGRQAALATRESPDVFTLQVAGLRPEQEVTVETRFVQLARPEGPGWSLRLPLTTAPRYVRGDEAGTRPAAGQPLGLLRDPGHRFTLDLAFRKAAAVDSPTHRLDVTRDGDGHGDRRRVRLSAGAVVPDRDCVLTWRPEQDPARPALDVVLHEDTATGQVYFLALVAPPATHDVGRGLAREVVLLVDHSGSMSGAKWQAADWAVERFLSDLTGRDAFGLGLFHNTCKWFATTRSKHTHTHPAEPEAVQKAVAFLKANQDSGGTELGVALEQALGLKRSPSAAARHVLVITDAEVSDAGRILRLADEEAQQADRRRISVLCIDAAPNSALALELAERGGGVARFLTSDPEQDDIATALDAILADWSEPVLAGLRLEVDRTTVTAAGRAVGNASESGWSAIDVGDLPAGRPLWVVGRAPRGAAGSLSFRLATGRGHEMAACRCALAGEVPEGPALKALFGARQLIGLEHLMHSGREGDALREGLHRLGYDPRQVLDAPPESRQKVYAENARAAAEPLRALLVQEALGFGLACSETAFLAERTEAGQVVEGRVAVFNALPAGWSEDFVDALCCAGPPSGFAGATALFASYSGGYDAMALSPPPAASRGKVRGRLGKSFFAAAFAHPSPIEMAPAPSAASTVVFSGTPAPAGADGVAILFDSARDQPRVGLPDEATLARLVVRFPDGMPDPKRVDPRLELQIFVDDLTAPRAKVALATLIKQRGERPLNLRKGPGQAVRISLADPAGVWTRGGGAPRIEVALAW
jgi:Ca-activated chloride channel family protein